MTLLKLEQLLKNKEQSDTIRLRAIDNWYYDYFTSHANYSSHDYDYSLELIKPYLTIKDDEGNTLIHTIVSSGYDKVLSDILKLNSAGALQSNHAGLYPIHTAILNNRLICAQILFTIPSVSSLKDVEKRSPIHYAALYGNELMVKLCCESTSNLDACDTDGKTALVLAIETNNEKAKAMLEQHGAHLP